MMVWLVWNESVKIWFFLLKNKVIIKTETKVISLANHKQSYKPIRTEMLVVGA